MTDCRTLDQSAEPTQRLTTPIVWRREGPRPRGPLFPKLRLLKLDRNGLARILHDNTGDLELRQERASLQAVGFELWLRPRVSRIS